MALREFLELLGRIFRSAPPPKLPRGKPPIKVPSEGMPGGKAAWVGIAMTIIAGFEGLYTHAYKDPVGVPTVCYGHIENVKMTDKYTKIECQEMLKADLPRYEAMVNKCIHVDLPPHRKAAIVSFTYNVGGGNLCKSSVARELNAGHVRAGCDALLKYVKAKGRTLPGLVKRRKAERELCLRED